MTDRQPTDITLAAILAADQADAATAHLAGQVALFYSTLAGAGMRKRDAAEITSHFSAMAISEHFGVNVGEAFGVGPIFGEGE